MGGVALCSSRLVLVLLPVVYAGGGRRAAGGCPTFAESEVADTVGDCQCSAARPFCYEADKPGCTRADGRRDIYYFSAACSTCSCRIGNDAGLDSPAGPSCQKIDGKAETDANGICKCPEVRPLCITRQGSSEASGCDLGAAGSKDLQRFAPACTQCSCRERCPPASARSFADAFGDCACSSTAPLCYEGGSQGCSTGFPGNVLSRHHFRATCNEACECRAAPKACDPLACITTADCIIKGCEACTLCIGISPCLRAGVQGQLDMAGNCRCADSLACFIGDATAPGCPVLPQSSSLTEFAGSCSVCECRSLEVNRTGLMCPSFARESSPTIFGDCLCPQTDPECYQRGVPWCDRLDGRRDLRYFSARCSDCECRRATITGSSKRRDCPQTAAAALSDDHGNCFCPPEQPLCLQGTWDDLADGDLARSTAQSQAKASLRPGPLCTTTHHLLSSTHFRHNCTSCSCTGLGDEALVQEIPVENLFSRPEGEYYRHYAVLDLRFVGIPDEGSYWSTLKKDLSEQDGQDIFAEAAAHGTSHLRGITAHAVCDSLDLRATRSYEDPGFETVFVVRFRLDFGLMWLQGEFRRRLGIEAGLRLKSIQELTVNEKTMLVNLKSVFSNSLLKRKLDSTVNTYLNRTWQTRKQLMEGNSSSDDAERTVLLQEFPKGAMTPHGVLVYSALNPEGGLPGLSWTGPLEMGPPVRRAVVTVRGDTIEETDSELDWQFLATVAGGPLACCLCCLVSVCLARYLRVRRQRRRLQESEAMEDEQGMSMSPTSPGTSPFGASRRPAAGDKSLSPLSPGGKDRLRTADKDDPMARDAVAPHRRWVQSRCIADGAVEASGQVGGGTSPRGGRSPGARGGTSPRVFSPRWSPRGRNKKGRGGKFGIGGLEIDTDAIRQLGDLAGHKQLSEGARQALENDMKRSKKKKRGTIFGGRKRKKKKDSSSPRSGESGSEAGSGSDSPRDSDDMSDDASGEYSPTSSPRSPRPPQESPAASPRVPDRVDSQESPRASPESPSQSEDELAASPSQSDDNLAASPPQSEDDLPASPSQSDDDLAASPPQSEDDSPASSPRPAG